MNKSDKTNDKIDIFSGTYDKDGQKYEYSEIYEMWLRVN